MEVNQEMFDEVQKLVESDSLSAHTRTVSICALFQDLLQNAKPYEYDNRTSRHHDAEKSDAKLMFDKEKPMVAELIDDLTEEEEVERVLAESQKFDPEAPLDPSRVGTVDVDASQPLEGWVKTGVDEDGNDILSPSTKRKSLTGN